MLTETGLLKGKETGWDGGRTEEEETGKTRMERGETGDRGAVLNHGALQKPQGKKFRFWLGGAAPQTPRILAGGAKPHQTPRLNGRSSL